MAGDWIKMRASLCTHPKVLMIAEFIGQSEEIGRKLSTDFSRNLDDVVTRDVTRDVTLASLLRVWCATNEHTDDGVWRNSSLATIDQAAGIPGFGAAMVAAGWAIVDEEARTVTMPNFLEYNVPAKNHGRSTGAERQARYRDRKKKGAAKRAGSRNGGSDATRNVTGDVTGDGREEKRREEYKVETETILAHLNAKAGRNYKPVEANAKFIHARLAEGATVADCIAVIDRKVLQWKGDPEMDQYLRPATLFNATKFAQYSGETGGQSASQGKFAGVK